MEEFVQKDQPYLREVRERDAQRGIFDDVGRLYDELVNLLQEAEENERRRIDEVRDPRSGSIVDVDGSNFNLGMLRQEGRYWHLLIAETDEVVRFTEEVYQGLTHEGNESSQRVVIFCSPQRPSIVIKHIGGTQ